MGRERDDARLIGNERITFVTSARGDSDEVDDDGKWRKRCASQDERRRNESDFPFFSGLRRRLLGTIQTIFPLVPFSFLPSCLVDTDFFFLVL